MRGWQSIRPRNGESVSRIFQRAVFFLSVVIFASLGAGFLLGAGGMWGVHAGQQDGAYKQIGIYSDVLRRIQSDYVTDPNMGQVTDGALRGLVESLDADSGYLNPSEYKIYKSQANAGNAETGLFVSKRFGYATVVTVLPGSPADKQHLGDGDIIESIGGSSTRDLSLAVIRMMLKGQPGSTVNFSVVRPRKSDPDKITLTRALLTPPALEATELEGSSILSLKTGALTPQRVDEIAARLKASSGQKIILDLRDSAGTDEQQGIRLANLFIGQGTLATLEGQKYPKQSFNADPTRQIVTAPLAVLINRGTYGAAELTAAAIASSKRGEVIGERSFGEGSLQKTIEMQNGSALILTVAKYAGPNGKLIQNEAVTPTIELTKTARTDEEEEEDAPKTAKVDEARSKAIELLKGKN